MIQIYWRPRVDFHQVPAIGHDPATDALINRWCELMELDKADLDQSVDREDWVESVIRLVAAHDLGLPTVVFGYQSELDPVRFFNGGRVGSDVCYCLISPLKKIEPLRTPENRARFGDIAWPHPDMEHAALNYATNKAFAAHAGRRVRTGTVPPDDDANPGKPRLYDVMAEMVTEADGDFLLKIVIPSKTAPNQRVHFPKGSTARDASNAVFDAFDWAIMSAEGLDDAILVQDYLPMGNEYRMFVMNGEPVCGAGCVESLCPLERTADGKRYDPKIETRRNSGVVRADPALAMRFLAKAREIAIDLHDADHDMLDYVLDLATTDEGEIIMIEANPISSSGLYAIDPEIFVREAYMTAETYLNHPAARPVA